MTSPVPGVTTPNPIGWGAGFPITTPRLRGDCTNLAALFAGGAKPLFAGNAVGNIPSGSATIPAFANAYVNTWQVPVFSSATPGQFEIPFAGFYLCQAFISYANPGSNADKNKYVCGFAARTLGVGPGFSDGGVVPGNATAVDAYGGAGAELYPFNTYSSSADTVGVYGFQNSGFTLNALTWLTAEWVGERFGTVVAAPKLALAWPSGQGTTITNGSGVGAGSSGFTVADATGMVPGGTLGLDVIAGQLAQPTAETVTIATVTGNSIGLTGTTRYFHALGAPVAVPVSAAFLNQQVRDAIRFLSYPPMMRAASTTTQAIATGTTGVQITNLSQNIDTFSGFASNQYTVPVSGVYFVYGQVYYAGATVAYSFGAGISISGGTIQWGSTPRANTTSGAQSLCATVRRHLRLTAGQTIKLFGYQTSGSNMNTVNASANQSKLIVVFRNF